MPRVVLYKNKTAFKCSTRQTTGKKMMGLKIVVRKRALATLDFEIDIFLSLFSGKMFSLFFEDSKSKFHRCAPSADEIL